ncbi:Imm32 family immunity protein [Geobacillus icigianus]|uniref:Uncharacterized protein n=2 Tax=Geobacillus TaxID=129337 RepID=A0A679FMB5_9BACL|nr:hypothetical protein [Geobacillus icigianus]MEB3751147.1 hypothetical protein [Geobacillus icigianus]BBW97528.1 hypothetical protein GsuE55_23610 [Geobacillus subterraneus]
MDIQIKIPKYRNDSGFQFVWEDNFIIETEINGNTIIIRANKDGLISMAKHLLTLAQNEVPTGTHIHYDELNSLEEGSCEIVIQKI